jgi:hypothetical protein
MVRSLMDCNTWMSRGATGAWERTQNSRSSPRERAPDVCVVSSANSEAQERNGHERLGYAHPG